MQDSPDQQSLYERIREEARASLTPEQQAALGDPRASAHAAALEALDCRYETARQAVVLADQQLTLCPAPAVADPLSVPFGPVDWEELERRVAQVRNHCEELERAGWRPLTRRHVTHVIGQLVLDRDPLWERAELGRTGPYPAPSVSREEVVECLRILRGPK